MKNNNLLTLKKPKNALTDSHMYDHLIYDKISTTIHGEKGCLFLRKSSGLTGCPLGDKKEHWPLPHIIQKHLNVKAKTMKF